jgi:hypothetical protein
MKLAIGLVLVCASSMSAQKLSVKMIDQQFNEDTHDYVAGGVAAHPWWITLRLTSRARMQA